MDKMNLARSVWLMPLCTVVLALALATPSSGQGTTEPGVTPPAQAVAPATTVARIAGLPEQAAIPADRPGFCLDLGCGDGKLAAEIAQKTRYTVCALAKDDADCAKARQTLDEAKRYGTRATAVAGSLTSLPFPDHYGNLIVTGEYQDALDLKEVFRVLNPNGLAVIGGGKTDAAKLKAAIEAAGIKDVRMEGNVALFRGKMPAGADEWTHFSHGVDNIQTSHESGIRPPFRTQWFLAHPAYDDKAVDHAAIGGGRIIYRPAAPKPNLEHYFCFDAFNGTLLWERPVSKGRNNCRYALVDGTYYGTENELIVALDAATGEKKNEFRIPGVPYLYWWWVAVDNGVLYGFARAPGMPSNNVFAAASQLYAFNSVTSDVLWARTNAQPVLACSTALDGAGGLYFCEFEEAKDAKQTMGIARCVDARTGAERWHTDVGPITTRGNDGSAAGCIDCKYFVWCCQNAQGVTGAKALDARTGEIVKDYPGLHAYGEGFIAALNFVGDKIYANTTAGHAPYTCVDRATGARVKSKVENLHARDSAGHASATCLYSGGEGGAVQDLEAGIEWQDPFVRQGDFSSPYPAEGLLFTFPAVCHCPHLFGAPKAVTPAGLGWKPPAADKDLAARLVKGPAFDAPLEEDAPGGWTHYRGNAGHTGEAPMAPKMPLKTAWEQKLAGRVSAPSFGDGLVFVGTREGAAIALDARTGEIRWRFLCGAGVRVTPAYGHGRVLFGSDDGWVYCLEAKTGRLAWRFRAAPEERYVNGEGQIISTWPSTAGVVLDGGTAYAAGGLLSYDGAYLYALDVQSGKIVWAKQIGSEERLDGAPEGTLALAGDTLIVPVFSLKLNSAFRKADGERIPWYTRGGFYWTVGSEAVADGDVFFYGGPRRGNDDWRGGHSAFTLMDMKNGWTYGKNPKGPGAIGPVDVAPVLGKQVILGHDTGLDRKIYCDTLQSDHSDKARDDAKLWSLPLWPDKEQKTSALVLAGDMALAAGTTEVVAFEAKKDGKELTRGKLPGKILRNSLAVASGDVFAVTEDGSVCCLRHE